MQLWGSVAVLFCLLFSVALSATYQPTTGTELQNYLNSVNPGDTITLSDNTNYTSNQFVLTRSGTEQQRIIIQGSDSAVLQTPTNDGKYVLYMNGSSYVTVKGFTLRTGGKGIVVDTGSYNLLDDIEVYDIGEEAVHFRNGSKYNVIQNSFIHDTGVQTADYGEGIYVGSDKGKWQQWDAAVDFTQILNNRLGPNIAAEPIDIKEGSSATLIKGNTFIATGIQGKNSADSWIDVKGNNCTIINNVGYQGGEVNTSKFADGIQTHKQVDGWGLGNVFDNNTGYFETSFSGYLIRVTYQNTTNPNIVYSNNVMIGGVGKISNIALTNKTDSTTTSAASSTTASATTTSTSSQASSTSSTSSNADSSTSSGASTSGAATTTASTSGSASSTSGPVGDTSTTGQDNTSSAAVLAPLSLK